jgi:predicted glutamine amidotransferase
MCRLLGIVASGAADFKMVLREAPRSMAALSREHRDGWGIAVFDAGALGWRLEKGAACAGDDARFHQLAVGSRGELLIAHIRKKTVGEASLANSHPFERGRWVFAHNGTVEDVAWLRTQASRERLAEVQGQTDSELLFAWLLTRLDEAGAADHPASEATDRALGSAARVAREHAGFGAFTFLLSDGSTTYAHRFGRPMYLLDLGPRDMARTRRTALDGTVFETKWSEHRLAVFIASERVTDEAWQRVEEGSLLRIDRSPYPHWRAVAA